MGKYNFIILKTAAKIVGNGWDIPDMGPDPDKQTSIYKRMATMLRPGRVLTHRF